MLITGVRMDSSNSSDSVNPVMLSFRRNSGVPAGDLVFRLSTVKYVF